MSRYSSGEMSRENASARRVGARDYLKHSTQRDWEYQADIPKPSRLKRDIGKGINDQNVDYPTR